MSGVDQRALRLAVERVARPYSDFAQVATRAIEEYMREVGSGDLRPDEWANIVIARTVQTIHGLPIAEKEKATVRAMVSATLQAYSHQEGD